MQTSLLPRGYLSTTHILITFIVEMTRKVLDVMVIQNLGCSIMTEDLDLLS